MEREQEQLVPAVVRGGVTPSLHLAVILPSVDRVVAPLSAAARMGDLVGHVGGRARTAYRVNEPTPVEGLLSRPGRTS
jgi:hypothetical protein